MLISIRIFHSNFQRTQKVKPKTQGRGHKKSNTKWGAYFVRLSHVYPRIGYAKAFREILKKLSSKQGFSTLLAIES